MFSWPGLLNHWSCVSLKEWLTALYITLLTAVVVTSNTLFAGFVASKPEGRKTVIGEGRLQGKLLLSIILKGGFMSLFGGRGDIFSPTLYPS